MRFLDLAFLHRLAPAAPVVLRVVVGTVMTAHGWQKLTDMGPDVFGQTMLADLGVPAPVLVGWLVSLIELIGGIALVLGLMTRISAALIAAVLVGATLLVKTDLGLIAASGAPLPGAELDLALIGGSVALLLLGPGRPSLDHVLGVESQVPALVARGGQDGTGPAARAAAPSEAAPRV